MFNIPAPDIKDILTEEERQQIDESLKELSQQPFQELDLPDMDLDFDFDKITSQPKS